MKYLVAVFLVAILVAGSLAREDRCLRRVDEGNCRPADKKEVWSWNKRNSNCERRSVCEIRGGDNAFRTLEKCRTACR